MMFKHGFVHCDTHAANLIVRPSDDNAIRKYSAKLGAGDDLYVLFAGILTMRPCKRVIDVCGSFSHPRH
ncbi:unnamed protein product [Eruca vesicaria subsp. sativa]|uniref:Uncharacterized protein n=1 Tax=Eruca vesicaria subsp. sativa TaxID=29727 RepID=A0ABC8M4J9_ERUVS|nr:unnamed protein product [Eruca vesicaria subsp. sativa]